MELMPDSYHIEVSASDYETKRQWADLVAGEDKYIDVHLVKRPVAVQTQATGKIFTNSIGMKFVLIPDGTFMMGSPSNEPKRYKNERQHRVTVSRPFYMQTTEVTQKQWRAIMGNNPSYFKGDNRPVERVSWNDAKEFIRKLNRKEGTNKYRLPTEAQWEYACRARTTTPFYTGRCISTNQANYDGRPMPGCPKGRERRETTTVGSFPPNKWGLYDMHGNVAEWCHDWRGDYLSGHVIDPTGPSSGEVRVVRGGFWNVFAWNVRSALRYRDNPGSRNNAIGFRLIRTIKTFIPQGVFLDSRYNLMWQKKPVWATSWYEARKFAEKSTFAGFNDWRMPTKDEILTIYKCKQHSCRPVDEIDNRYTSVMSSLIC